ncbi:hypothetical protein BGZ93_000173 [Podila epicladia]|nr:hypothetical protein BGZ92_003764 [Podila epicladia]KAG0086327.1 hypothetical protein BGZ93_000173 [Podila epicladia]
MPASQRNFRRIHEKTPYSATRRSLSTHESSEDYGGSAQGEQLLIPGDHRDQDERESSASQLDMISIDDGTHLTPASPILPELPPPFSPFDSTARHNDTHLYHYNSSDNTMHHDHVAVFNTADEATHTVVASQSSLPVHHVTDTPHATTPFAYYASVYRPVSDFAVPGITVDWDPISLSGPARDGVMPEDTFITFPADQVALAVAIIVDLAVQYATRIEDRWLCPFTGCPQVHVGSKDSLKHHLHRIHYRPNERLHCSVDGCNRHFGYYLDLNRHHAQVHLGVGHVCPCTGKWYSRLETLKKRCRHGLNCPGAIDRRGVSLST